MASTWITHRTTRDGSARYRVEYRLGGRESKKHYGGSFPTQREARERRRWIDGELAALRVPDLSLLAPVSPQRTVRDAAEAWRRSRVDVAAGTMQTYLVAINRLRSRVGTKSVDAIDAHTVADLSLT